MKYRHFYWELERPKIGKYRGSKEACVLTKIPCKIRCSPLIGRDNEYVLKNILGMLDGESPSW